MNAFELFEERLAAKLDPANAARFDPTIILMILGIVLPLVQDCLFPTPERLRRRKMMKPRLMTEIRRKSRREAMDLSWSEAEEVADACFDVADESSDDECKAFIRQCCD